MVFNNRFFQITSWSNLLFRQLPTRSHSWANKLVSFFIILAVLDLLVTWWQPIFLPLTAVVWSILLLLLVWFFWFKIDYLTAWLAGSLFLFLFWSGSFNLWLFFNYTWQRIIFLFIFMALSWWYLSEWQRHAQKFFALARAAGPMPTMVVGAVTVFILGASANNFLVYLDVSFWKLLAVFFSPLPFLFWGLMQVNNWSLAKHWPYGLAALFIQLQAFVLVMWLPLDSYVSGFCLAVIYIILALSLNQEAQGFINKRQYIQEIIILLIVLFLVLLTAAWF
ncbi:hypothetical protein KKC17_00505 [Patescibacteria group bacterium]|nr:hypothetical protein [Patescibacteria group bacterium]